MTRHYLDEVLDAREARNQDRSPEVDLFIASRKAIPHDGSRRVIADGRIGDAARQADDDLMAELGAALRKVPGEDGARDAAREAWHAHQQRGGTS